LPGGPVGYQGRGARSTYQPLCREIVSICVTGTVPGANANTTSRAYPLAGGFDQGFID
jgi:hypothetical protein